MPKQIEGKSFLFILGVSTALLVPVLALLGGLIGYFLFIMFDISPIMTVILTLLGAALGLIQSVIVAAFFQTDLFSIGFGHRGQFQSTIVALLDRLGFPLEAQSDNEIVFKPTTKAYALTSVLIGLPLAVFFTGRIRVSFAGDYANISGSKFHLNRLKAKLSVSL